MHKAQPTPKNDRTCAGLNAAAPATAPASEKLAPPGAVRAVATDAVEEGGGASGEAEDCFSTTVRGVEPAPGAADRVICSSSSSKIACEGHVRM